MSTIAIDISILLNILGFGQGLFLSFSLFKNRSLKPENTFLIVLLLAISLVILNSIFRLSYYVNALEFYQDFSNSFLLLIPPSVYLFICAKLNATSKQPWFHYTPFLLYFSFLVVNYFTLGPQRDLTETGSAMAYLLFNLQFIVYFSHSLWKLKISDSTSEPLKWISVAVWLIVIAWFLQLALLVAEQAFYISVPDIISLNLALFFGACTFFLSYAHASGQSGFSQKEKYEGSKLKDSVLNENLDKIYQTILDERLYKDPSFSQHKLAERMNMTTRTISLTINQGTGKNFMDFINSIRIDAFKRMIQEEQAKNYTMVAIAEMCGFKSSSTFYTAFKKHMNMTPKEYQDSLR